MNGHHSTNLPELRPRILRECRKDWDQLNAELSLEEASELFCNFLDLPMGHYTDRLGQEINDYVRDIYRAGDDKQEYEGLKGLALSVEPYLKRVLELCDPNRWSALHQPPPDWKGDYEATLKDLCGSKGFDFYSGPKRIVGACNNTRPFRNDSAHGGRQYSDSTLSSRDIYERTVDCLLVMLWATYKYRCAIRYLLLVQPMRAYLEALRDKWKADLRRWILLQAGELQTDLLELTAGEEVFQAFDEPNGRNQFAEEEEEGGADESIETDRGVPSPARQGRVHDLIREVRRLVLTANAGAGKTTSLRHFAYEEASHLLDGRELRPLPLYVELRYYKGDLWQQLTEAAGVPQAELQRQMADGKWCLLLDGLNEVHNERLEEACREIEKLLQQFGTTPVVITSRSDSCLLRFRLPIFRLNLLTDEQIVQFISKHFGNSTKAQTFSTTLQRHKALWEWGRNPLQLWMLVQVGLRAQGGLPENRGQLLRAFVEYIFRREESKGPQINRRVKEDLLTELAYQTRQAGQVSFSYGSGLCLLRERCHRMGYAVDTAKFVTEVCDNVLLVEQGEQLAFAHEMYQEYFAALGLKKRYEENPEIIERFQNVAQWREPIVLLYGLLESPSELFKRVVLDAPQVAAECVTSAVEPNAEQTQQLRERIAQVDYGSVTDEELARVLQAIYILGDGQALARHLLEREKRKLLQGIAQQIASAFTGEEPAVDATLVALEILGLEAKRFVQPVLAPFRSRPAKISRQMSERAERLAQSWRESDFNPVHVLTLAVAYKLSELAFTIIQELIGKGKAELAGQYIRQFRLQEQLPPARLGELLLAAWQVHEALDYIRQVGLQKQLPPAPLIEKLLAVGQVDQALTHIRQFGLQEQFPPAPLVNKLLAAGRVRQALSHICLLGLQEQFPPERRAEILLAAGHVHEALDYIRQFGLQKQFPPAPLIQKLLAAGQVDQALTHIRQFGLQEQFPPVHVVERLLAAGQVHQALNYIRQFGLQRQFRPAPLVEKLLAAGQLDKALEHIRQFGLQEQFPPERIGEILLAAGQVHQALRHIRESGLQEQFPPTPLIEKLVAMGQVGQARRHIRQFDLQQQFPPERVGELLLAAGHVNEALDYIRQFGLQKQFPPTPLIEKLLTVGQVDQALTHIRQFGLQEQFPPWPLVEKLLAVGQVDQALSHICLLGLQEQFPPWRIYACLIDSGHSKPAADYASSVIYKLIRSDSGRAIVNPLLDRLGFHSDQVEHNLRLLDRVERANKSISEREELPPGETLTDIELYGWVKDQDWLLVPGFRDFRMLPGQQIKAGQIVRFRLCVSKHPKWDNLVLNAVDVTPT